MAGLRSVAARCESLQATGVPLAMFVDGVTIREAVDETFRRVSLWLARRQFAREKHGQPEAYLYGASRCVGSVSHGSRRGKRSAALWAKTRQF